METTTVPKKESYTKIHGGRQGMPTTHIDMTDNNKDTSDVLTESVEELRERLDAMKKLIDDPDTKTHRRNQTGNTVINASFLSTVFSVVLFMIISVSFYAFWNLYHAIVKKFHPKEHTEL